jgi:hypothetical protein
VVNGTENTIFNISLQHTLADRGGYVLEIPREHQNRDARSSDFMEKMGG